ncbi:MAG: polymerase, sigma-24 subunit, subfamily [Chloroflexi bacterium]|nr:polymerase, sigma-24 subunit, subfamily [Chloroflexota bacterium]
MEIAPQSVPESEFQQAIQRYRAELHLHCYRITGSLLDADDLVQESLLRAWRGRGGFMARGPLRAWLYRIATNVCLDAVSRRRARIRPTDHGPAEDAVGPHGPPVAEATWLEPYPDSLIEQLPDDVPGPDAIYETREAVELAFLAAIQLLPPRQRAVLLLRDVLGWSAAETAALLETSVASANSALQRARATLKQRAPERPEGWRMQAASESVERSLVERYLAAWDAADASALVALLKEDATLTMPPAASWYCGRAAIARFLDANPFSPQWRGLLKLVPTRGNRHPGFAVYHKGERADTFDPFGMMLLRIDGDAICEIASFTDTRLFVPFGLPPSLPGESVGEAAH